MAIVELVSTPFSSACNIHDNGTLDNVPYCILVCTHHSPCPHPQGMHRFAIQVGQTHDGLDVLHVGVSEVVASAGGRSCSQL